MPARQTSGRLVGFRDRQRRFEHRPIPLHAPHHLCEPLLAFLLAPVARFCLCLFRMLLGREGRLAGEEATQSLMSTLISC